MPIVVDIVGKKYNKLTVIMKTGRNKRGKTLYLCRCDCGEEPIIVGSKIKNGATKSCGCAKLGHGQALEGGTSEYNIWRSMKQRCSNSKDKSYPRYGGRGIKVCKRWTNSFENFIKDVGERPTSEHSIDRKKNDGNYEPTNCKWSTRKEQANNTRTNRIIEYNGIKKTLSEWSESTGLSIRCIKWRLDNNWTVKKALITPSKNNAGTAHSRSLTP